MSVAELAESMKDRVAEGSFDSVVKFDCGDDGVLVIDNQSISTEDQEADCTISVSLEDLQSIVAGELDPTGAFMQGKLKVDGDMSVAMKLGQVL
ncbi:SCP2 sterol-binding domain-containing protein [Hoeflea poritis]|uniref:SCP2 sterol-binding domain-containing protein n=1 Tax=Hoeflea poritis TaxID=2993659 RepID=A0ABT4VRB2_9HYPH|nr:SCP2 sterol-binding domain-containing protein [Hoeflea poritis]MDA4847229.1 SCP2 sterol-binding domain-containing protein [Hoeflea poritis]